MIGINPIFIFIVRWVYASISQSHNKNSLAKASILAQILPMLTELELRAVAGINRIYSLRFFGIPATATPFESVNSHKLK